MRAKDLVFLSGCTMLALYSRDFSMSACLLKFVSLGISLCSDYANFTAKTNASALPRNAHFQMNTHTHTCTQTEYIITFTELQMAYCMLLVWKTSATVTNETSSVFLRPLERNSKWYNGLSDMTLIYKLNANQMKSHTICIQPSSLYTTVKPFSAVIVLMSFLMQCNNKQQFSFLAVCGYVPRIICFFFLDASNPARIYPFASLRQLCRS